MLAGAVAGRFVSAAGAFRVATGGWYPSPALGGRRARAQRFGRRPLAPGVSAAVPAVGPVDEFAGEQQGDGECDLGEPVVWMHRSVLLRSCPKLDSQELVRSMVQRSPMQILSAMRGRWQPNGWVSTGGGGSSGWAACQTASITSGSSARTIHHWQ